MMHMLMNHCRHFVNATLVAFALLILALPVTQNTLACAFEEFAVITEKVMRFPCTLLDHHRCFILDRLDPTCPQCL